VIEKTINKRSKLMKEQQQDEQLIYYYNMNDQDIVEIIYETDEVEKIEAVRNNQGEISFRI